MTSLRVCHVLLRLSLLLPSREIQEAGMEVALSPVGSDVPAVRVTELGMRATRR